jgi:nitrate reductase alpha subunit
MIVVDVAFPYFGGIEHDHFKHVEIKDILEHKLGSRKVPVRRRLLKDGEAQVATVFDLLVRQLRHRSRSGRRPCRRQSYDECALYAGLGGKDHRREARRQGHRIAREFADQCGEDQRQVHGHRRRRYEPLVPHGHELPRPAINMLVLCGCIGQSGGGWSHYVGQEKLRPQTGWQPLAFGLDWAASAAPA